MGDDYKSREISTDLLNTENHGQLEVKAKVDTLGMATITFGNSFTLRINEFNTDELRSILYEVSRSLAGRRVLQPHAEILDRLDKEAGKWNIAGDGELNEVPATIFFDSNKETR